MAHERPELQPWKKEVRLPLASVHAGRRVRATQAQQTWLQHGLALARKIVQRGFSCLKVAAEGAFEQVKLWAERG
jgi:hypothetical protein